MLDTNVNADFSACVPNTQGPCQIRNGTCDSYAHATHIRNAHIEGYVFSHFLLPMHRAAEAMQMLHISFLKLLMPVTFLSAYANITLLQKDPKQRDCEYILNGHGALAKPMVAATVGCENKRGHVEILTCPFRCEKSFLP